MGVGALIIGGGATFTTSLMWPYFACKTGSDAEEPNPSEPCNRVKMMD